MFSLHVIFALNLFGFLNAPHNLYKAKTVSTVISGKQVY